MNNPCSTLCINSPVGAVTIHAREKGITDILFALSTEEGEQYDFMNDCKAQLEEYFSGKRQSFHDLPLIQEGTDFQQSVWDALDDIPFGQVLTYGELATKIHNPRASQAVGQALTRNPLAIIVPCHRIVPSSGVTGGYAYGENAKEWLLTHERTKVSS